MQKIDRSALCRRTVHQIQEFTSRLADVVDLSQTEAEDAIGEPLLDLGQNIGRNQAMAGLLRLVVHPIHS